ncbi:MAG TPA: MFS transporter [Ktedonobacteraceae bacterium]|jgi:predicted MFS family arabinose efflux permease
MESSKTARKKGLGIRWHLSPLWYHRDFLKVWAGQTISLCGSQVTLLAFPLTAILVLHASAAQMGFLQAAEFAPFLLIGLAVGVWVDRLPRRPVMIIADIGRFLLIGCIPLVAVFHILNIYEMYVIAFAVGTLTIFFDVAYRSYLPSLISREQLIDGNSKLELTASAAELIGPGLGGVLIQLLSAPISLLVDTFSFLLSALSLGLIRSNEPPPARPAEQSKLLPEISKGLRLLLRNPLLGPLAWSSINITLCTNISTAVYILYATTALHISPIVLGIIYAVGGVSAIPGAMINNWITQRLGIGVTAIIAVFIYACGGLLVPLALGPQPIVIAILMLSQFFVGLTFVIWNINQLSLRQMLTPNAFLGRVNASYRFLVWGAIPIGAVIGGGLGTIFGLHTALFIGAISTMIAPVWMVLSPVRRLRTLPEAPVEDGAEG